MPRQDFDRPERFKDPAAYLDFKFNWEDWLEDGEVIVDSTWESDPGISLSNPSHFSPYTVVWVSGGEAGNSYLLTNTVTTNSTPARVDVRSMLVCVVNR